MLLNPITLGAETEALSVTANGTYTAPAGTAYSPVTVNVPSGGAAEPERDVNFIDYDGTIVHSYTAAEFAELTALPDNPSHDGLTAQGWNWSLADAQEYVADYGKLWVGQMYITDDGKTRIYIKLEEGQLSPFLGIAVNGSVDVDWGDGSAHDTVTGDSLTQNIATQHDYAAAGEYVIVLDVTGSMQFYGSSGGGSNILTKTGAASSTTVYAYANAVQRVEIGANCHLGYSAFYRCHSLTSVTIPENSWAISTNTVYLFGECYSLTSLTIPNGVTALGSNFCASCHSLKSVALPAGLLSTGDKCFYRCTRLNSITVPNTVTSFGQYFVDACHALRHFAFPSGATLIPFHLFYDCYSLVSVTIPSSVTTINQYSFSNCYNLAYIKFTRSTPPKVNASPAFDSLPTSCVIYVPRGTLSAYKTATNYPSSSKYTYVEYDP